MIEVTHMLYALVVLGVADAVTTYVALRNVEGTSEANKLMAWFMEKIGLLPTLVAKLGITLVAVNAISKLPVTDAVFYGVAIVTVGYILLVINNTRIVMKGR